MAVRIVDLTAAALPPQGTEIAEISTGGTGSFKIAIAILALARPANNVTSGGTTSIGATAYGDVLVNFNGAVTIQLPGAASRSGVPISVVDIGGFAQTHNILILPNGVETIMGQSSLSITANYGSFYLWPISTGNWYTK